MRREGEGDGCEQGGMWVGGGRVRSVGVRRDGEKCGCEEGG